MKHAGNVFINSLFRTFEKGGGTMNSVVLVFFHAKSGTTNNPRNGSTDIPN